MFVFVENVGDGFWNWVNVNWFIDFFLEGKVVV